MIVERVTTSGNPPFSMRSVASFARVMMQETEHLVEPDLLASAATAELEQYAQIALLTQTIRVTLEHWPERRGRSRSRSARSWWAPGRP